jgi:hypothetical protein
MPGPSINYKSKLFFSEDDFQKIKAFSEEKKLRPLLPDKWARYYDCCIECKGTDYPHVSKGLCKSCFGKKYHKNGYFKNYRENNADKIRECKNDWYKNNREKTLLKNKVNREKNNFDGNREIVLKRDNFRCTECGSTEKLVVHHIDGNGRGVKKELKNNKLDNLITLCRACHARVHGLEKR